MKVTSASFACSGSSLLLCCKRITSSPSDFARRTVSVLCPISRRVLSGLTGFSLVVRERAWCSHDGLFISLGADLQPGAGIDEALVGLLLGCRRDHDVAVSSRGARHPRGRPVRMDLQLQRVDVA